MAIEWRELTEAEDAAGVAGLRELAAGRGDLLAEVAGVFEGASEREPDEPLKRQAAQLRRKAGADPEAIPAWIQTGRARRAAAKRPPFSGGLRSLADGHGQRVTAAALWRQAGITVPLDEIDVAEIYVPFSWYEPVGLENLGFAAPGQGWRLTEAGETALGGRLPVNPSGGVLSSNPIGASGLLRFAESALQVMGKAGAHQVPGARIALGHAYGGGSQFFSMWVVSSTPR